MNLRRLLHRAVNEMQDAKHSDKTDEVEGRACEKEAYTRESEEASAGG